MRRAGFTLIEILIVVGIIVIMLATAVMSVASGRGAVQAKEATRGVIQLSRYASALALLRQRPVVVTFHRRGKIEVRISTESAESASGGAGAASEPIYREVDGVDTLAVAEESDDEAKEGPAGAGEEKGSGEKDEKTGYFHTRRVLDPAVLAKEDAEGEYEGVTFTVEVLGEDGKPLEPELAAMRSLRQPKREKRTPEGELAEEDADDAEDEDREQDGGPVSVTYETNGSVNPHRVIVRLKGESEASEGFAINISRTGRATVGDDEEEEERGSRAKRRRRR